MNKPEFLFIAEPWIRIDQFPRRFFSSLHLKVFADDRDNLPPNLWCIFHENISPSVISRSTQHVSFSINWENRLLYCSAVPLIIFPVGFCGMS